MKLLAFSLSLALFVGAQADTVGGVLKRAGITISNCATPNSVALTFDDGPNQYEVRKRSVPCTPLTLRTLRQLSVIPSSKRASRVHFLCAGTYTIASTTTKILFVPCSIKAIRWGINSRNFFSNHPIVRLLPIRGHTEI